MYNVVIPEMRDVKRILGERERSSHKGNFGYVGLVGGCARYSGAVKLASLSLCAMRSGAGVARVMVPKSIVGAVSALTVVQTVFPLPDKEGYIKYNKDAYREAIGGLKAVAFGMGLGLGGDNLDYLKALLQEPITLIIDADGLNTLAQNLELLSDKKASVLITPHVKEFARLSGLTVDEVLANPIANAVDFANRYGVVVLLKGADTVITDGNKVYVNVRGTVGMATAGSGDVLSGILVGLAGYIDNLLEIGIAGAYVNGLAGEIALANNNNNAISMIATDTAEAVKEAISTILNKE